jgi:lysozyme
MSAVDQALPRVMEEEGFRPIRYTDTRGLETIGYGFQIAAGISERAAQALLREQMAERHDELVKLPWYTGLNEVRQGVCLDIAINNGTTGLLRFHEMIDALEIGDWETAAKECHVQNPELTDRYKRLADILRSGQ